ncbi:hypothetical protein D3C71_1802140 [compost metagenome]
MATAHAQRDIAIAAAQHRGDRVAVAAQADVATDAAGCLLGQFCIGEQLTELDSAQAGSERGADLRAARIHADGAADVAPGHAEVERLQPQ